MARTSSAAGSIPSCTYDYYENVENIVGTDFVDNITGSSVTNTLEGRNGNDSLFGMGGVDFLFGDSDDDVLDGGAGGDTLNGGGNNAGGDTASYQSATAGVVAVMKSFGGAPAKAGDALGDTYIGIENLRGSNLADTLIGNGGVNYIEGLAGNDTLIGRQNNDTLVGGLGLDTADYSEKTLAITVTLNDLQQRLRQGRHGERGHHQGDRERQRGLRRRYAHW